MKRVISLLVLALFCNSCDDGNLTLENIDFDDITTIQSCANSDVLFKLKEKEALLLQIPKTTFVNDPSDAGAPTLIDIDNSTYRVIYRFYNGAITADNICSTIPPANPSVTDQWTGTDGKISILTTAISSTSTTDNITRITGYNHAISFKNITFARNGGDQKYETFAFGNYVSPIEFTTPFAFDQEIEQCATSKQLYNYINQEALTIDNIDPSLIVPEETPLNTPRKALIGTLKNKLTYRLYKGVLGATYFCNATTPLLPVVNEEWNAENGVEGISGVIEVSTIKNGTSGYKHTIVIKKASLWKGNSKIYLGDAYTYGVLLN